ncbi:constitutive coactivator of peroxisome proliferator-activated receptor gamma-like [Lycorma delicatula]|uniref:constitutive coactivator of peroxisome proliferator-activated receptor gamma-like n=1 Tax=Lycorma delicatula TaxID=130591 RepID=UPI003F50DA71
MGVSGLLSFLENYCPSACYKVKIETLLEEYRQQNGTVTLPTIVVDGTGCLRSLYGDLDWVCGGQMKEFKEVAEHFVQSFKNLNVRLVFFFDGPTVEEKRPRWVERRIQSMRDVDEILNLISMPPYKSQNLKRKHRNYFILPPGLGNVARFLFKTEFGCEVHVSVKENDEEIAEFARKENCFAVLAQDTDFVILEGAKYYLSMANLRLTTMETTLYDRSELAVALSLDKKYLPLLATLMGNDIVKKNELTKFHTKISKKNHYKTAKQVAAFINDLQINDDDETVYDKIAEEVFGDTSKSSIIKYSVESYKPISSPADDSIVSELDCKTESWKEIVREALRRHRNGLTSAHVWAIVYGQPFELSTALENYRSNDMPFAAQLYCPLRQRMYGILLKEKPFPEGKTEHQISEWVVVPGFELMKSSIVISPIYPTVPHPGLLALWNDSSQDVADKKWNLFVNAVSETINGDELKKLDSHLILPAAAIRYMYEYDVISEDEAKAFIATAVVVSHSPAEWLRRLNVPKINERAVRLATLYTRGFGMLTLLVTAIGEPVPLKTVMPWLSFDGKLFQKIYDAATRRKEENFILCNKKEENLDAFYKVASVVFNDPLYKNRKS